MEELILRRVVLPPKLSAGALGFLFRSSLTTIRAVFAQASFSRAKCGLPNQFLKV